ncbi:MAG TPA: 50S ribosomal protein L19 [bacterium]|nr:50S ribosomal protein L19 [bacterium]
MTETKSTTATPEEQVTPTTLNDLKPGMTVRIHQRIKELNPKGEEKERVQYFDGLVIARKHGSEAGSTVTVRKISNGVGVEKIFPINLPTISKVEIKKQAIVHRAKLTFLKKGYKKRLKDISEKKAATPKKTA